MHSGRMQDIWCLTIVLVSIKPVQTYTIRG
jgi:hypothetical protein